MARRDVEWLFEELPKLVDAGVLSSEAATRLRDHYRDPPQAHSRPLGVILLAVFGALLIGLGIILVLATNWDELSRPVRAVISFLPLLTAHGLVAYTLARRGESTAWREGSGTFLILAVGACIALIGQTYNIPGNLAGYLLTWTLLCLALPYLLGAVVPGVLCLAGIVGWALAERVQAGQALLFWALLASIAPYAYIEFRRVPYGPRWALLGWSLAAALCVGVGVSLTGAVPGLWILGYSGLFASMYLLGRLWKSEAPSVWRRPFFAVGAAGTAAVAFIVSFQEPWKRVGWQFARYDHADGPLAWAADYLVAFGLPLAALAMLGVALARGQGKVLLYGTAPLWAGLGFAAATVTPVELLPVVLLNAYVLVLGIGTAVDGIRENRLVAVNGGMVILTALIVARFFDSQMGMAVRGVAFILLGTVFLVVNLVLIRRKARQPEEVQ